MGIITLTTDMGVNDYYVASLKGKILQLSPDAQIVDISHMVSPFKIKQAAMLLRSCMYDFPENTVHIIGVDAEPLVNFSSVESSILPTIMKYNNQYFICVDNGIFSLILGKNSPESLWRIDDVLSSPQLLNFSTKNISIPAACKIINGQDIASFCSPIDEYKRAMDVVPIVGDKMLKGTVIHIDHYENVITNITSDDFYHFGKEVPFTIYFRQKEYYIDKISTGYNEVPAGEKVALFNDSGYLEIAINKGTIDNGGGARSLFGLRIGDIIRIEFTPKGSRETLESMF